MTLHPSVSAFGPCTHCPHLRPAAQYLEHAEAAGLDLPAITKELAGREWREHAALDDTELARGIERSQGGATTRFV
jgi:hypothetical protein